ncbi:MAG TPA: DUF2520 domain-containing protein [Syntrophorhabdaceae bacterium]|nr:DUF2520 domain-containing protein [Syntrophorhabdaceae bacterium]
MRIGIIGAGKVGISIGYVLKNNGMDVVALSDRRTAALDTARGLLGVDMVYTSDNLEVVGSADVIALTTQDRVIQDVVREINDRAEDLAGKLFFHTSGADPCSILMPLDEKGAHLGSLHPLQTFPDIESAIDVLPDTSIFIEGDDKAREILRFIGENLGAKVHAIESADKVLYHLAAVTVCNLLSALMYTGVGVMERIGIGLEPFIPIIRATMKNIENKGPLAALTGPIMRGDDSTVRAHIEAIRPMPLHEEIYRALSRMALEMSVRNGALDEDRREAMRRALEGKDE